MFLKKSWIDFEGQRYIYIPSKVKAIVTMLNTMQTMIKTSK